MWPSPTITASTSRSAWRQRFSIRTRECSTLRNAKHRRCHVCHHDGNVPFRPDRRHTTVCDSHPDVNLGLQHGVTCFDAACGFGGASSPTRSSMSAIPRWRTSSSSAPRWASPSTALSTPPSGLLALFTVTSYQLRLQQYICTNVRVDVELLVPERRTRLVHRTPEA